MKEEELIAYFNGTCSKEQAEEVELWALENEANKDNFIKLKNLYISSTMPIERASDNEYLAFKQMALNRYSQEVRDEVIKKDKKPKKKPHNYFIYSAAACVAVLLVLNLYYNWLAVEPKEPRVLISSLDSTSINTLYAAKGTRGEVILPDGSKVWLNSDSRIKYPANFSGASREVEFSGEGYFDVVKDSTCPMIIRCSKGFRVEVYGTSFNIKSYDNDEIAQTTLYSGSIKLVRKNGLKESATQILPNETYYVKEGTKPQDLEPVELEPVVLKNISAWKDGVLVFDSKPLKEVAKILDRRHGYTINIENKSLENLPITAKFKSESLVQILELLRFSTGLEYSINENQVLIK